METRTLGRTGREVGVVGLGCWQLGGDWGVVDDPPAVLEASADAGVTLFDTADVYGDGRSESLIGEFGASRVVVATKVGRRVALDPALYTPDALRSWVDRSRAHLRVDTLDLVQLHCPPEAVYSDDRVFAALDDLIGEGRIAAYGVSVETCAQALAAIARPRLSVVQIILNCLRLKPLDEVLPAAREAGVGILARVPLASGLLSGRYDETTSFAADDHRSFNRTGEAFDIGETFSGVPYAVGLAAARELRPLVPDGWTTAQFALRWILDRPGVTAVIPGARNPEQARGNAAVGDLPPLPSAAHEGVRDVYDSLVRAHVRDRW